MIKSDAFAIATELLSDAEQDLSWSNLGAWDLEAGDYVKACLNLARRVGEAAWLDREQRILDLACGFGASLVLWREEFQVAHIDALERREECLQTIRAARLPMVRTLPAMTADQFFQQGLARPQEMYDAIVCVDAAYHFQSSLLFIVGSFAYLKPQGRLAYTTLLRGAQPGRWYQEWALKIACRLARIPTASVVDEGVLRCLLQSAGYTRISVENLDEAVLDGFAQFVRRRQLPWRQRLSLAYLKIWFTGLAAAYGRKTALVHYVMVAASRS